MLFQRHYYDYPFPWQESVIVWYDCEQELGAECVMLCIVCPSGEKEGAKGHCMKGIIVLK